VNSQALSPRAQARVLSARYLACTLGDWRTVLLLLAQAPFIGWLCTVVWGGIETDTPSLYYVLCLSSVWFGCVNACREVVKERAVLERERFFGLSLPAYVMSKVVVLAALGLAQVVALQVAVEWKLSLQGNFLLQTLALWGASLCGTGLGLLVSAWAKTQERAVGAIPLLILPQILFSEFSIPMEHFGKLAEWIERFMPVRWAYRVFTELAADETAWWDVFVAFGVLGFQASLLASLAVLALIPRRET
jgi:ABC-type multidrug transport system permease subunit